MKLYIYATRNKKSGSYSKLGAEPLEEERAVEAYSRSVMEADEKAKILLQELELYFLGEYDDATGTISPVAPKFLLDLGTLCHVGQEQTSVSEQSV
jgi:hypothetical protein